MVVGGLTILGVLADLRGVQTGHHGVLADLHMVLARGVPVLGVQVVGVLAAGVLVLGVQRVDGNVNHSLSCNNLLTLLRIFNNKGLLELNLFPHLFLPVSVNDRMGCTHYSYFSFKRFLQFLSR